MSITLKPSHLLIFLSLTLPMAASANAILEGYKAEIKGTFTAAAGEKLYKTNGPNQLSCASCHTDSPKAVGKHAKTNKAIDPLAPSANPKRFTDLAQVEKWFKRNCNDVLSRACTTQEKGDFMTYVLSVK
jgi:hypothetical protein